LAAEEKLREVADHANNNSSQPCHIPDE